MKSKLILSLLFLILIINPLFPQTDNGYNPQLVFDPSFDLQPGSRCRSGSGAPGSDYWLNKADYKISVILDDKENTITGNVEIDYVNNSPDNLDYVWLQLDQNRFRQKSKSYLTPSRQSDTSKFFGGFKIGSVKFKHSKKVSDAEYIINDTRMQIRLPKLLKSKGGILKIYFSYSYKIPPKGVGRSGFMDSKNGKIYEMAQWYPRMAVYDDLKGWNNLPFLGNGEFYLDYGNFDYKITVPWYMIVAASGKLLNPEEVLTKDEIDRLNRSKESNSTIFIIDSSEIARQEIRPVNSGNLTWHFSMENTRDVSWAASKAFIWDAAKINLPGKKECIAMSLYPVESAGENAWGRSTEYVKKSVEIYSKNLYEYPYPAAINIAGPIGGMEYPGIVFCHWSVKSAVLWRITTHEIGHNWFPMIVGSNERENAWMDEGFDTFINISATEEFNHGEYAPKRDNEYAPHGGNPAQEIIPLLTNLGVPPIISFADAISYKYIHPVEYYKTALGLVMLREKILGHERFDYAFKTYIKRWAFKHPSPVDFFRTMNDASGDNLNWFWKEWFYKTWNLDQSIESVEYIDGDTLKGAVITIKNNDKMVMPVTLMIMESNGNNSRVDLPVEIWEESEIYKFNYKSASAVNSIIIDPDESLPDKDRENNIWTASRKY